MIRYDKKVFSDLKQNLNLIVHHLKEIGISSYFDYWSQIMKASK